MSIGRYGRGRLKFREPVAVTQHRTVARLEAMAGRELPQLRKGLPDLPKKRAAPVARPGPTEDDVLAALGDLLQRHPRVLYAMRMNSGMASYEAKSGRYAPVYFHKWIRAPQECAMSDYYGALLDGRAFAFECKHPLWKMSGPEAFGATALRERRQAAFLSCVRGAGGIGEFITDAEQAAYALGC